MNNKIWIITTVLVLFGCVNTGSSSKESSSVSSSISSLLSKFKVKSANVRATDKGLLFDGKLLRIDQSGDISAVEYVLQNNNQEVVSSDITILDVKILSRQYTALKFSNLRVGILEVDSGNIYDLDGVVMEEMQINNNNLYFLNNNTHQLSWFNLINKTFQVNNVNNLNEPSSNTGMSSTIWSSLNMHDSPFRYTSTNQYGKNGSFVSPSFLFVGDYIAALAGPSGGKRVELFKAGAQAFDCQSTGVFNNVGGGFSAGLIQSQNNSFYQVRIVNSQNCALPGVTNCGDTLLKLDVTPQSYCYKSQVVTQLNNISRFTGNNYINAKVNYGLNDVDRYIIHPNGFIHTQDDGMGGVTMGWTNLDLSDVPVNTVPSAQLVVIHENSVFWLKDNTIHIKQLAPGAVTEIYYSSTVGNITWFDIIKDQVIFNTSNGESYTIKNGYVELIEQSKKINSTVQFY